MRGFGFPEPASLGKNKGMFLTGEVIQPRHALPVSMPNIYLGE